jgi:hypothetical protein
MGVTGSHPHQRHGEAPVEKVRQATPTGGRRLYGVVSRSKIRRFLVRPAAEATLKFYVFGRQRLIGKKVKTILLSAKP